MDAGQILRLRPMLAGFFETLRRLLCTQGHACVICQGRLVLTLCCCKGLEHVFLIPTARAAFHGYAVFVGVLLQQGQCEAI